MDSVDRENLLAAYELDKFAASGHSTRQGRLETWIRLVRVWFGEAVDVIPVSVEHIAAVGAVMKYYGYRSFAQYASRARELQIRCGFAWTDAHALEAKHGDRSVTRGQGPPRQSAPLPVNQVQALVLGKEPLVKGGLLNPVGAFVFAASFMLREVELAYARYHHMRLDKHEGTVTIELPVGKTDPCALGCERTWGCLCPRASASAAGGMACPYHAALEHAAFLATRFEDEELHSGDFPLFPAATGRTVAKDAVVRGVEQLGSLLGEPLQDSDGTRRFGGHSFRVSGAQWLAARGVPIHLIQNLARWESDVVRRYVGDAALASLTMQTRALVYDQESTGRFPSGRDFPAPRREYRGKQVEKGVELDDVLAGELVQLRAMVEKIDRESTAQSLTLIEEFDRKLQALGDKSDALQERLDAAEHPDYVLNVASGAAHAVGLYDRGMAPAAWRTRCGAWAFGMPGASFRFISREEASTAGKVCRCVTRP